MHHAQLSWPPGGGIMLGSARDDTWALQPGTFGAYVVAENIDALYERVTAAGADIIRKPGRHRLRLPRVRAQGP